MLVLRRILIIGSMLLVAVAAAAVARQPPQETHDGLQLQSGSKEPVVYSRPGADRVLRHWARLLNSHLAQLKKS